MFDAGAKSNKITSPTTTVNEYTINIYYYFEIEYVYLSSKMSTKCPSDDLTTENERKLRVSTYVMYYTIFFSSVSFSIVLPSLWPFLQAVSMYFNTFPLKPVIVVCFNVFLNFNI